MMRPEKSAERRVVAGVEVVTIPASEYADLIDCRRRLAEAGARASGFNGPPISRIERDPEVAALLASLIGTVYIHEARTACLARFGSSRTPSRSAIHRYWQRLRPGYGRTSRRR